MNTTQSNKEIWKPIPNYENEYLVSNLGNFKSLPKSVWNGHGFYITSEKNIKPYKTKKGYFSKERILLQIYIIHSKIVELFSFLVPYILIIYKKRKRAHLSS